MSARLAAACVAMLAASEAEARIILVEMDGVPVYVNVPEPGSGALPRPGSRRLPWLPIIEAAAQRHGVDARLIEAVVACESDFDPRAVSSAGAEGLMQLMPETQRRYGLEDPFDGEANIHAGTRHLRDLLDAFENDWTLCAAAYNAGAGAVRRAGGVPPFRETADYVRKVRHYASQLGASEAGDGLSWSSDPPWVDEPAPVAQEAWMAPPPPEPAPEPARPRGPKPVITRDDRGRVLFTNRPAGGP